MYVGELIKEYRKNHNLSMQDFANISGISKAYIGVLEKIYNPKTKEPVAPTLEKMKAIAGAMGMSLDEMLKALNTNQPVVVSSKPQPARGVRIPVLGRVVAGIPIEAITDIIDYEEIPAQMAKSGTYFALQVKGRSMEPTLHEGDVVIVRQQPEVENGEIAIVLVNGNDATVKEIKESPDGLTLIGHNVAVYTPHFYTRDQIQSLPIQILGKVVELRRKL